MISADSKDFSAILEVLKSKQTADIGVLVGYKYSDRIYIYAWCQTPKQDQSSKQLSVLLNSPLTIPEATYSDWVLQHCKELFRLLPAGLQILGFYSVAEEDLKLDNFSLISPAILKLYSDLTVELQLEETLCLFHYNLTDGRFQTGNLDLKKKVFVAGEIRQTNLVRLEEIRGSYKIDLELGADGNGQELVQRLITEWNLVLENSLFVIDKQIPKDDAVLVSLRSSKSYHTVQVYSQIPGFCCNFQENRVRINGFIQIFTLAHPKATIRTVKELIIKDLLFSLKNRVESVSDDCDPDRNPFLSAGKSLKIQLPRRISFSTTNFSLTGYTLKDPETLKSIIISISSVKPTGLAVHETLPEFPEIVNNEQSEKTVPKNPKIAKFWAIWLLINMCRRTHKVLPSDTLGATHSVPNPPPSVKSKYLHVWQSARIKLKFRLVLKKLIHGAVSEQSQAEIRRFKSTLHTSTDTVHPERFPRTLIHPDNKLVGYWNMFIGLTIVYCALFMPFFLAFQPPDNLNISGTIDWILTGVYFCDFIINCSMAGRAANGELITKRSKILAAYLKSWMIVDIIAFIPFDLFFSSSTTYNHLFKLARVPQLYRILKISKIIKWFKYSKNTTLIMKLQDIFSIRHAVIRMIVTFIGVFLSIHIAACLWYFLASVEEFSPSCWVYQSNLLDADITTLYITSFYWAFTTFSSVGYGDIVASSDNERIFAMIWMLISLQILGFTIATLSGFLGGLETRDKLLLNKLAIIDEFAMESGLKKHLRLKIRNSLRQSSTISGFSLSEKHQILFELPRSLRFEVALAMHRGAAKILEFFQNKDDTTIYSIIPFLIPMFVNAGNFVYEHGEIPDQFYFVMNGRVLYMNPLDFQGIYTIKKKDYFGDIEVMVKTNRQYSALCKLNAELLVFGSLLLSRVKRDYPKVWLELKSIAKARFEVMAKVSQKVAMLRRLSRSHSPNELAVMNFQTFHKIRREMKNTLNARLKVKHEIVDENDVERKFVEINEKIQRLKGKVEGVKDNKKKMNIEVLGTENDLIQ